MQVSPGLLQDKNVPLSVRTALANAALAYADVLAQCNGDSTVPAMQAVAAALHLAAEDVYICAMAADLGMSNDD